MLKMPFQKLKVWQKGMDLVTEVYKVTRTFPTEELYGLTSQMRRAAVSVPSNLAEGSQRGTNKDFSNFLLTAKGSLAELKTQVLIAQNLSYLSKEVTVRLISQIEEIDAMIHALHQKLTTYHLPLTTS